MSWRVDVKKPKKVKKQKLPTFFTRTVVVWGLTEEQKNAEFIKDTLSTQGRIEKITIIKKKPAIKVRFRHQDDAIKVRSNKKLFKDMSNIYLKYGKDEKSVSIAPNIDDDLADLANLAGSFSFASASQETASTKSLEDSLMLDDAEEMSIAATSITGLSERGALMKKLQKHSKIQENMQEEMEVASMISSKINALPPTFNEFTVPEKDRINLDEILSEELLDNELMDGVSTAIKCRFVLLSPVAWVPWIKAHLGLTSDMVHVVKDQSKIFIRLFSWSESRQIDDAFDGILLVNHNEATPDYTFEAKKLPEIKFNVPSNAKNNTFDSELRNHFRNALRQSFAKFAAN
ncbi:unnamed protein product [Oikopleura dioica]|uniref:RRM domain-containing protein n=1 Tax=Oikopleura dioica TaxID=34765 RepID=E4Y4Y5_OIKDI|nr:unnamed protein product [Oikopleura dioica]